MRRAIRITLALALAAAALGTWPASATDASCAINPLSTATVSDNSEYGGGIYYPGAGGPDAGGPNIETVPGKAAVEPSATQDGFSWGVSLLCANGGSAGASGTATGWCGHSIGTGSGTYTDSGGGLHPFTVDWVSAGSQLILIRTSASSSVGSVNATPNALEGSSCANAGGATSFLLTGAVTHTV